jgi:radical SAM superfamily enzyme YgiQ (UPF0313 family)
MNPRRRILLAQLPIPPLGPAPIRGNVPLAAAYLQLFAESRGLGGFYDIHIIPDTQTNVLGDLALVDAIAECRPWMVGFTCYLWNIERTLWIARELKRRQPEVLVVLGGPEITADNAWVLESPECDYAVIGEGEQTFANLLLALLDEPAPPVPIAGLYVPPPSGPRFQPSHLPAFRTPMADFDRLGSPYLAGILDAADEQMLLLETTRGCVFKCKFCYYPKSYDRQYYLSPESIRASLRHAQERGVREVFLLDPTLNQRKDFSDFLRLLIEGNPGRTFSYFGELRAEGVTPQTAHLLAEANFTEVEVGLQSVGPEAMSLMDRRNNLRAFERGVRAMRAEGIRVKVDLIIGLPGDTVESIRHGLHYLHEGDLCDEVQVFNLAVLPGTAFRHEAAALGLVHQPRPPYYVLQTPTLARTDFFRLMHEAQDLFGVEFDAQPRPVLDFSSDDHSCRMLCVDLDEEPLPAAPRLQAQAFTLWLRGRRPERRENDISALLRQILSANPFTTLQVVLEPTANGDAEAVLWLQPEFLAALWQVCQERPTYLDRFCALLPGRPNGAKRLVLLLPAALRPQLPAAWIEEIGNLAAIVWQGPEVQASMEADLAAHEYARAL